MTRQSQALPTPKELESILVALFDIEEEQIVTAVIELLVSLKLARKAAAKAALAEAELFALPRCNGRANYSSSDAYAGAYLYAVHGTGQECPLHGTPKSADGRIRKGVGSSQAAHQPVLEAMANYTAWQEAQAATMAATANYTRLKMNVLALGLPKKRGW